MKNSNAQRFIDAYNKTDQSLRAQYNFKRSMSFSDVVRRSVLLNAIVRKYEDLLIDYGRLRNAIVHQNNDEMIIAEPHLKVVEKMEQISTLVSTPPKILDTVARKDILCVDDNISIKKTIEIIAKSGYSNLPIYKNEVLVGVANGQRILDKIGYEIYKKNDIEDYIQHTLISEMETGEGLNVYYALSGADLTIDKALDMFYNNRKLLIIVITKTGNYLEQPLGIITNTDIIDINKILDNFLI
ncbi:MAG: CBS domain-containing protein [Clostridia bacterium]|nr:CBS domain-containing protein [Clostridia bacterium]